MYLLLLLLAVGSCSKSTTVYERHRTAPVMLSGCHDATSNVAPNRGSDLWWEVGSRPLARLINQTAPALGLFMRTRLDGDDEDDDDDTGRGHDNCVQY
jgi:hypothetical protein